MNNQEEIRFVRDSISTSLPVERNVSRIRGQEVHTVPLNDGRIDHLSISQESIEEQVLESDGYNHWQPGNRYHVTDRKHATDGREVSPDRDSDPSNGSNLNWMDMRKRLEDEARDTIDQAQEIISNKNQALMSAKQDNDVLIDEVNRMKYENDQIRKLYNSEAATQRGITLKIDAELESMTQARDNILQQYKTKCEEDRVGNDNFHKYLQSAQSRNLKVVNEQEDITLPKSLYLENKIPTSSKHRKSRSEVHFANSTSIHGEDHVTGQMSKVGRQVSEFMPLSPIGDDEASKKQDEEPNTDYDDMVRMSRGQFEKIMETALDKQRDLANVTSAEAIKIAYNEGIRDGNNKMGEECPPDIFRPNINSEPLSEDYRIQSVHKLRPETEYTMNPPLVNQSYPVRMAANIPTASYNSVNAGSNKTLQPMSGISGKRYKRESSLKFSEGNVEVYESFRSQFCIQQKMLGWDNNKAGIELYMSLGGKAALKVEEVVMNANGNIVVDDLWTSLDRAFLPIDHRESKYRQFASRKWKQDERLTEYMDELIRLFRKARPGTPMDFQDEEVKNRLLAGLPSEILGEVSGYLDLSVHEIARKHDLIVSQRQALGMRMVSDYKTDINPLMSVTDKQIGSEEEHNYCDFEQVFAFKDGGRQNKYKDEICAYCNKKGHTETVCFAKRDDEKLTKMAEKLSATMAQQIAAINKASMESILNEIKAMNLKK